MKEGISSNNQETIFGHFVRTKEFVIYEVVDQKIISDQYLENTCTRHAQNRQDHKHDHHGHSHGHSHGHGHIHDNVISAFKECNVIIAGGMGRHMYNDLINNGFEVYMTEQKAIDDALNLYFSKQLDHNPEGCCNH